jgi:hypothetical protein
MKIYSFVEISYFDFISAVKDISLQASYCYDFQNLVVGLA